MEAALAGKEVRLRHAYVLRCTASRRPGHREVTGLRATIDPETRSANPKTGGRWGRHPLGVGRALGAGHAADLRSALSVPNPGAGDADFRAQINPRSLEVLEGARVERALGTTKPGERYQFERKGYYFADPGLEAGSARLQPDRSFADTWAKAGG